MNDEQKQASPDVTPDAPPAAWDQKALSLAENTYQRSNAHAFRDRGFHVSVMQTAILKGMRFAAPQPPALGGEPVPEYFQEACDKFDWAPEEALRFYAEGKHFDTDNGRTRILCTGAIASHALKAIPGQYAEMKGFEAALGGEPEVLGWRLNGYNFNSERFAKDYASYTRREGDIAYLIDRAHLAPLQAEIERLNSLLSKAIGQEVRTVVQRDKFKALLRDLVRDSLSTDFNECWDSYLDARDSLSTPAGSEQV